LFEEGGEAEFRDAVNGEAVFELGEQGYSGGLGVRAVFVGSRADEGAGDEAGIGFEGESVGVGGGGIARPEKEVAGAEEGETGVEHAADGDVVHLDRALGACSAVGGAEGVFLARRLVLGIGSEEVSPFDFGVGGDPGGEGAVVVGWATESGGDMSREAEGEIGGQDYGAAGPKDGEERRVGSAEGEPGEFEVAVGEGGVGENVGFFVGGGAGEIEAEEGGICH